MNSLPLEMPSIPEPLGQSGSSGGLELLSSGDELERSGEELLLELLDEDELDELELLEDELLDDELSSLSGGSPEVLVSTILTYP